jgi:hypothetical protein
MEALHTQHVAAQVRPDYDPPGRAHQLPSDGQASALAETKALQMRMIS